MDLQHDYAVSCPELDFLVDQTRNESRILGSRMMGGGFGGCTINLVEVSAVDEIAASLSEVFQAEFGHAPEVYITSITDGCRVG